MALTSTDPISGTQSLQLTATTQGAAASWNTLLKMGTWTTAGSTYKVEMKAKVTFPTGVTSGTFNLRIGGGSSRGLYVTLNSDGTYTVDSGSSTVNSTCSYDSATGAFTLTAYVTAVNTGEEVDFVVVDTGNWVVTVDDISFTDVTTA